ncbi:hypothetical protein M758_2G115200 [Ceratodon purpureus]|nr:hypothetical protein M758_2G115200 [Ceratodon purpureus]
MAPEKAEVEVKLGVPVERMWSAAKKIEVLMPQVLPDVFVRCDLEGDGGPGSIRVYHCGPAIQEGFVIRERVDEIDDAGHSMSYTVVEGDPRYKSMRATIRYVASEDGASSSAVFNAEYDIDDSEEGFSDEITEMISLMQTSLCEYLLANPTFE